MSLFDTLLTIGATLGLAYVGKKQNDEAKLRNQASQQIVLECNKYIDEVNLQLEQRKQAINDFLIGYGDMKQNIIKDVIGEFADTLKNNFTNFEVVTNFKDDRFKLLTVNGLDKMQRAINQLKRNESDYAYKTSDQLQKVFLTSLATFGVGATIGTIAGGSISNLFPLVSGFTLTSFIPISFGVGYSVVGFINNYKSKQNMQDALQVYNKVKEIEPKVNQTFNYLNKVAQSLDYINNGVINMANELANTVNIFKSWCSDPNNPFYSSPDNKMDLASKDDMTLNVIRYIYLYCNIVYAALDRPLFLANGELAKDESDNIDNDVILVNEAKRLITYGK